MRTAFLLVLGATLCGADLAAQARTRPADPRVAALLDRARRARLEQDSALVAYEANVSHRVSVGLGFLGAVRERLALRSEAEWRVRWHRDVGATIDVVGSRVTVPLVSGTDVDEDLRGEAGELAEIISVPYYPGRETLWPRPDVARPDDAERRFVHPLGAASEDHYRFAAGGTAVFRMPDGREVRLVELRITPRRLLWNVVLGSFWFDETTGQLVRAAYRPAVPLDLDRRDAERGRRRTRPQWLQPMIVTVNEVLVEYGLHEGRWWLPRAHSAHGDAQVAMMRIPFTIEEGFAYRGVFGAVAADTVRGSAYAALRDSTAATFRRARAGGRPGESTCASPSDTATHVERRFHGALDVVRRTPCDTGALARSPALPPSAYETGEALFEQADAEELRRQLDEIRGAWSPQRPEPYWGPGLLRYNRVEGLSAGAGVRQRLGRGYTVDALARIGQADRQPNGELSLRRETGRDAVQVTAFRRLVAANDWGAPLSPGASLASLLFARDEGFYHRAWGAELGVTRERVATLLAGRLFAERHDSARVATQFSIARLVDRDARFVRNIQAEPATLVGMRGSARRSAGLDPAALRLTTEARVEAATGDFDYVRGAVDATVSRALGDVAGRGLAAAVTARVGTSGGRLPVQRLWYLGGSRTVRGHDPSPDARAQVGDAFWMGRAELGANRVGARPVLFYDVGWAGDRHAWRHPGTPLSGAGVGASFLDGLVRIDVSRGLTPRRHVRADIYTEASF